MNKKSKKIVRLCLKCFEDDNNRRKAGQRYAGDWKYNYDQSFRKACHHCGSHSRHGLETEVKE